MLFSPPWQIVPGKTASTAGAEDHQSDSTAQLTDFRSSPPAAAQCGSCHSQQFQEWSGSFHAQSLTTEGFLRSFPQYLESLGSEAQANPRGPMACLSCHAPLLKDADVELIRQVSDFVRTKQTSSLKGFEVGCVACHLNNSGVYSGPIADPKENPFHVSSFSPSYGDSSFCGACHTWQRATVPCSDVHTDWKQSKAAEQGQTCQSCHMAQQSGIAGAGGPVRKIQSHSFPGGRSAALLEKAVVLSLKAGFRKNHLEVTATVRNLVPHRVPDG
jgi:nitrate/TMAO reductase-like tetraheme cytochrome c subunit